jgi:tetratricopeptide (TPR) repeat protein
MLFKTIIQGKLDFGNEKTYDKVIKMYKYRAENYHKSDVLFEEADIFSREKLTLEIPRLVKQVYEKTYKNTATLLAYCSQFAVSGVLDSWLVDSGKILHHEHMEPTSDKAAVQAYLKGRSLVKKEGEEENAIKSLTKAIEKFDRHAQAYERRAKVNYLMKKYDEALRDYNKSIALDTTNPYAYFGRAKVAIAKKDFTEAIKDLELVLLKSVALQDVYWKARRLKSECHIVLEDWDKAIFDLKLFTNRNFKKDNPNIHWRRKAFFDYGIALMGNEEYEEALKAIESSIELEEGYDKIPEAKKLRFRGIVKQKAGKKGYIKDIKDAADLGDKEAALLLKSIA